MLQHYWLKSVTEPLTKGKLALRGFHSHLICSSLPVRAALYCHVISLEKWCIQVIKESLFNYKNSKNAQPTTLCFFSTPPWPWTQGQVSKTRCMNQLPPKRSLSEQHRTQRWVQVHTWCSEFSRPLLNSLQDLQTFQCIQQAARPQAAGDPLAATPLQLCHVTSLASQSNISNGKFPFYRLFHELISRIPRKPGHIASIDSARVSSYGGWAFFRECLSWGDSEHLYVKIHEALELQPYISIIY